MYKETKIRKAYPNQLLIGLAGYAGSGKDTIADAMGFAKASFAQALKDDLQPLMSLLGLDLTRRADKERAREMLVAYGKFARGIDPDVWIKRLDLPASNVVVITDVRYTNEAQAIHEAGGWVIRVHRSGVEAANGEEWLSLEDMDYYLDFAHPERSGYVNNDRTPHEAAVEVERLVFGMVRGEQGARFTPAAALFNNAEGYDGPVDDGNVRRLENTPAPGVYSVDRETFQGVPVQFNTFVPCCGKGCCEVCSDKVSFYTVPLESSGVRAEWGGVEDLSGYWNGRSDPAGVGHWFFNEATGDVMYIDKDGKASLALLTADELKRGIAEGVFVRSRWMGVPRG